MGLDMYLYRKTFIWSEYDNDARKEKSKGIKIDNPKYAYINAEKINYITEEVGYWRKANQIHKWFVDNVQGGKDDCGEYKVSKEQLEELLSICKRIKKASKLKDSIIKNGEYFDNEANIRMPILEDGKEIDDSSIAEKLLPTQSGFFFGSIDYDEYYMANIDNTIEIIEGVLKDTWEDGKYLLGDIYYSSSW